MSRAISPPRIAGLVALAFVFAFSAPLRSVAQRAIGDILGHEITACQGAIAWSDGPNPAALRVEILQIEVAATEDADPIVVYSAEQDTKPEDDLTCADGICTAPAQGAG